MSDGTQDPHSDAEEPANDAEPEDSKTESEALRGSASPRAEPPRRAPQVGDDEAVGLAVTHGRPPAASEDSSNDARSSEPATQTDALRGSATQSESQSTLDKIKKRVFGGTTWTLLGFGSENVIRLVANLILTRLLFPEAFGVMAIVMVFVYGLVLFTDLGIQACVVQSKRGDDQEFLNTAFTMGALRGVVVYLLCALVLTYPMQYFLEKPDEPLTGELWKFLLVVALGQVIEGFLSTKVYSHSRRVDLAKISLLTMGVQVFQSAVMIVWAYYHPSVWALVGGTVAKSLLYVPLTHFWLEGKNPRFGWDPSAAREIFDFGKWLMLSAGLGFLTDYTDKLYYGKLISLAMLGFYQIAATLAVIPVIVLFKLILAVMLPILSRLQDEPESLVRHFIEQRTAVAIGGGCLLAVMCSAGLPAIEVLYDYRYQDAGWILQILLVGAWFKVLDFPGIAFFMATGRTRWLSVVQVAKLVALVIALPAGFFLGKALGYDPFVWSLGGLIVADIVKYLFTGAVLRRMGPRFFLRDVGPSILLALSIAAGLWAVTKVDLWIVAEYGLYETCLKSTATCLKMMELSGPAKLARAVPLLLGKIPSFIGCAVALGAALPWLPVAGLWWKLRARAE